MDFDGVARGERLHVRPHKKVGTVGIDRLSAF